MTGLTSPTSTEIDSVDEASRESMDASDPPARSVITRIGEPKRPQILCRASPRRLSGTPLALSRAASNDAQGDTDDFTSSKVQLRVALAALALALFAASPGARAMERRIAWITTKVKMALLTADDVPVTAINVDTVDGHVTLHGIVATDAEKAGAETAARADRRRAHGAESAPGRSRAAARKR